MRGRSSSVCLPIFTLTSKRLSECGSNDSMTQSATRMNPAENTAITYRPTPDASPSASVESITPASFGSSIFAR